MRCHIKHFWHSKHSFTQRTHHAWTDTCVHTLNATPQCTSLTDEGHSHTQTLTVTSAHILSEAWWWPKIKQTQAPHVRLVNTHSLWWRYTTPLSHYNTQQGTGLTHCAGANNTPNRVRAVHTGTLGTSWGFCMALTRSTQLGLGSHTSHPLQGLQETQP